MTVLENEEIKLLWDFSIQTEMKIGHNNPDLIFQDKREKRVILWHSFRCGMPFRYWKEGEREVSVSYRFEVWAPQGLQHGSDESAHNTHCRWCFGNIHKEHCQISSKDWLQIRTRASAERLFVENYQNN